MFFPPIEIIFFFFFAFCTRTGKDKEVMDINLRNIKRKILKKCYGTTINNSAFLKEPSKLKFDKNFLQKMKVFIKCFLIRGVKNWGKRCSKTTLEWRVRLRITWNWSAENSQNIAVSKWHIFDKHKISGTPKGCLFGLRHLPLLRDLIWVRYCYILSTWRKYPNGVK